MLTQVVWGDNLLQHKWSPRTTWTVSCMTGLAQITRELLNIHTLTTLLGLTTPPRIHLRLYTEIEELPRGPQRKKSRTQLADVFIAMEKFSIRSCVRGYHIYSDIWEASVGK